MKSCLLSIVVIAGIAVIGGAYIYSGLYDIGADTRHWPITEKIVKIVRERSIESRAKDITVPNLENPKLVLQGAGQYAAMCAKCHLAPRMDDTGISLGLYPKPPDLSQTSVDPKVAFWVVKHGIKMSGMPAWGRSHDDLTLWSIVAFVSRLPGMEPQEYKDIVAKSLADEENEPRVLKHSH